MNKSVICKDVFGNEYKHNIEDLKQTIRAYVVIIENNKILLTKQWNGYSLVGGGVEKGESLEDTIVRETKEETGLDIVPNKMFYNTFRFFQRKPDTQPVQAFQFYFSHKKIIGTINNKAITESEKDYTNGLAEWVDLKDIDKINFRHSVDLKEILQAYFNDNKHYFQSSTPGKLWIQAIGRFIKMIFKK